MNTFPVWVGKKVLAYNSNKDIFVEGTIVRVYDEDTYEKEHYTDRGMKIPEWMTRDENEVLVDVKLSDRVSRAHFVWGLREVK